MHIRLFTHNDLDGFGCIIVTKVFAAILGNPGEHTVEYSCHSNNAIDKDVWKWIGDGGNADLIIFADIRMDDTLAEYLDMKVLTSVLLCDHHKTALPLAEKYDWAHVWCGEEGSLGVTVNTKCGALVLMEVLTKPDPDVFDDHEQYTIGWPPVLVEEINRVDAWDTWKLDSPYRKEAEELDTLSRFVGIERMADKWFEQVFEAGEANCAFDIDYNLHGILEEKVEEDIADVDRRMLRYEVHGGTMYWEKRCDVVNLHPGDLKVGVLFSEWMRNGLGYAKVKQHFIPNDVGMLVIVNAFTRTVSLRSTVWNVRKLAEYMGGGGHDESAGYPIQGDVTTHHGYLRGVLRDLFPASRFMRVK